MPRLQVNLHLLALLLAFADAWRTRVAPAHAPAASTARAAALTMVDKQDALTVLGGALARANDEASDGDDWQRIDGGAWLRLPSSTTPWAVAHFVGGAALGAAPQVCYDALLSDVCERAGVAVIATPYEVGPDHGRLAAAVADDFETARRGACEAGLLPASAQIFRVGHSLGAKLLVVGACEREGKEPSRAPLGLLAFNNFGVADSVRLASSVAQQMQGGAVAAQAANAIADALAFAQMVGGAQGVNLEFSPSPAELQTMVAAGYAAAGTRLVAFDADELDCSEQLVQALPAGTAVERASLPGGHLAPASLELSLADLEPTLAAVLGAQQTLRIGDAAAVRAAADELVRWMWPTGMAPPPARALMPSEVEEDAVVDV